MTMSIKFASLALAAATLFSIQAAATEEKELSKSDCGIIKEVGGRRACRVPGATLQLIIPKEAYDALPAGKDLDEGEKK